MYVGVILIHATNIVHCWGIPHVCGGDPICCRSLILKQSVFPMYVGVILPLAFYQDHPLGIPHVCGGDPLCASPIGLIQQYSPCMWG